jgi:hypothetical protein
LADIGCQSPRNPIAPGWTSASEINPWHRIALKSDDLKVPRGLMPDRECARKPQRAPLVILLENHFMKICNTLPVRHRNPSVDYPQISSFFAVRVVFALPFSIFQVRTNSSAQRGYQDECVAPSFVKIVCINGLRRVPAPERVNFRSIPIVSCWLTESSKASSRSVSSARLRRKVHIGKSDGQGESV